MVCSGVYVKFWSSILGMNPKLCSQSYSGVALPLPRTVLVRVAVFSGKKYNVNLAKFQLVAESCR